MKTALLAAGVVAMVVGLGSCASSSPGSAPDDGDPYAEFVWPPPPDEARIRLVDVIHGRVDIEATSRLKKTLLGASPQSPYDRFQKPFAVAFDDAGRLLVTDTALGAVLRIDRSSRRFDVFGTTGAVRLKSPLGLTVAADGTVLVADVGIARVVAFDPEGKVVAVYGRAGDLVNPTDAAVSPDGGRVFVTDSKAHRLVVFDRKTGEVVGGFGSRGEGEGEFNFPTSVVFGPDGDLYVVDQINSRVQVLAEDGEHFAQFGSLGTGFGNFVRPKDVAVDRHGTIYVTDAAFNNVQLFDYDFRLLTFVGDGGSGPGQFRNAAGVAVHDDEFAVVDQLNRRVQLFRYVEPRGSL